MAADPTNLGKATIDTVAKYAFAVTEDDLTQVLKAHFSLDPAANLANWAQVACFVVAWQTAADKAPCGSGSRQRDPGVGQANTAVRVCGHTQGICRQDGKIEDKVTPAKEYLKKKHMRSPSANF